MTDENTGRKQGGMENRVSEFEELSGARTGLISDLWEFLKETKKWWLAPIIGVLLLVAVLVILGSSSVAPFVYTLF